MTEITSETNEPAASPDPSLVSRGWSFVLPLAGTLIGCLGALCGIGGGLFATPLLNLGVGLTLTSAIATSLVLVFATACSATIAEAFSTDSRLVWPIAFAVALGAFLGARAGYRFVQRLGAARLAWIFGSFLLLAGIRLLVPGVALADQGSLELGAMQLALALGVGLVGGTVAPMLGIGGGVVMVPGLALLIDGLGFESARACALAAATVGAARSVALYARRGRVDWRHGFLLAAGALIGATIGVQLAHIEGAGPVGKRLLGVLVIFVSLRYFFGAWREARAKDSSSAT